MTASEKVEKLAYKLANRLLDEFDESYRESDRLNGPPTPIVIALMYAEALVAAEAALLKLIKEHLCPCSACSPGIGAALAKLQAVMRVKS